MNDQARLSKTSLLFTLLTFLGISSQAQHLDWVSGITGNDDQSGLHTVITSTGATYNAGHFYQAADFDP